MDYLYTTSIVSDSSVRIEANAEADRLISVARFVIMWREKEMHISFSIPALGMEAAEK